MEWIESLVLGAVQGLTEFLPVSSDGHLAITQNLFARMTGVERTSRETLFFFVMLHLGTLTAVAIRYRAVAQTGARGLLGAEDVPPAYRRPSIFRLAVLVFTATLPLVIYAKFKDEVEETFKMSIMSGIGFLITAAVLLVTTRLRGGEKGLAEMTILDALLIGFAQMFAPLPGVSRSGLTVAAALSRGLSRTWAVGFSLLIAFPAILGATVFEIKDLDPKTLTPDRIGQTLAGTIVAGVVGYTAILWLVKVVRAGRLWCFAVYLIVMGTVVIVLSLAMPDKKVDAPSEQPPAQAAPAVREAVPTPIGNPKAAVEPPAKAGDGPSDSGPQPTEK